MSLPRCITLVGPSGAGITTVAKELESMGYEIIQPTLLKTLEEDSNKNHLHAYIPKIWDALDHGVSINQMEEYAQSLAQETQKCKGNITIYLYSELTTLTMRQEESRLKTRLSKEYNLPHQKALNMEHKLLEPFRKTAQIKLDTTNMDPLYARRTVNLLLSLGIPFETSSYTKVLDHVVGDFFRLFQDVGVIKEILSQQTAAEDFSNNANFYSSQLDDEKILASNQRVFLVGEGSSLSSLESAAWLLHKGYQELLHVFRIPASDLRFTDLKDSIVVICSNSGNTAEIRQNIEEGNFDCAKYVIGITNHPDSVLGEYTKQNGSLFTMDVMEEKSIAATVSVMKSVLIATAILARISEVLSSRPGIYARIFDEVSRLPTFLKELFSKNRLDAIDYAAKVLSKDLDNVRHGYLVAAGMLSSTILPEASLKAKELARLHLEPVTNSLFHGPLNPNVERALYLQDPLVNLESMKQHIDKMNLYIPHIITVGPNNLGVPNVYVPATSPVNSLILHLVTIQLIYFFIGLRSGYSLDEIQHPIRLSKVVRASPLV